MIEQDFRHPPATDTSPGAVIFRFVADQPVEQANAVARTPAVVDVGLRRAHRGPGDVEMRPRRVVDETLQELRRGDRTAVAPAGILHVGELRVDHLVVFGTERHAPDAFAGFVPILLSRSASSSLLENMPAYSVPSATMIAPVSVARSTMNLGLNFFATYQSTSASTSRPSASVLMISMVWPDIEVTISPGRCVAVGHVLDQADGADRVDLRLARRQRMHQPDHAGRAAHVAPCLPYLAAPLMEMPPVSKQTPCNESNGLIALLAAVPAHDHGAPGCVEPCATPSKAPMPSFFISLTSSTSTSTPSFLSWARAARELHRIQHVRRLVDEFARDHHAVHDMDAGANAFRAAGDIADGDRNVGAKRAVLAVLLLGLVAVEFVRAQPDARRDGGGGIGPAAPSGSSAITVTAALAALSLPAVTPPNLRKSFSLMSDALPTPTTIRRSALIPSGAGISSVDPLLPLNWLAAAAL